MYNNCFFYTELKRQIPLRQFFILLMLLFCLWQGLSSQHSAQKLPYPVNTEDLDEICPVVSAANDILFFTRVADPNCEKTLIIDSEDVSLSYTETEYKDKLRKIYSQVAGRLIADPYASTYNQDIWYTRLSDGLPRGIFHPGYPINDVLPNSICSVFGSENAYIVINQFAKKGGIDRGFSVTEMSGGNFSFPIPVQIDRFNKSGSEVNLTAAADSSVVILAMQDDKRSDGMDLFVCFRLGPGRYSQPVNMGSGLNTTWRESTPVLSHDLKRIYFTSDRPGGMGGSDIYCAEKKDFTFTSWTTPVRLNPPVNSPFDDSHPHIGQDGDIFYFTSNRDGTSDIFRANLKREPLKKQISATFTVINGNTGKKCQAELIWGEAYQDQRPGYFRAKEGKAKYIFYENKPMVFKAVNRDLYSDEVIVDPQDLVNEGLANRDITLTLFGEERPAPSKPSQGLSQVPDRISEGELYSRAELRNIYFERTKPDVLPESLPVIKKLAGILMERPRLYILIAGHTDNVGESAAKLKLSEDRAAAIKNILVEMGVPEYRVNTAGYGDQRPIAPNDTEENKSLNRRVEIRIVSQ